MRTSDVTTLEPCLSLRVAIDGNADPPGVGLPQGFGPRAFTVAGGGATLDLFALRAL